MRTSLAHLFQTTTFRLGVVQAFAVIAFVVLLLSYVYVATLGQLLRDADLAVDAEFASLARVYEEAGPQRVLEEVDQRAAASSPFLYALTDPAGRVAAGSLASLPVPMEDALSRIDFDFERPVFGGSVERGRARGRVGRLGEGRVLLVASDLGESATIAARLTRALMTVAILGGVLALASGLLAAHQAARRAAVLSRTTREVMAGDLSSRAPVAGLGDEFDQLAMDINAMLDRIETLVHALRTAGDAIAHDLRSPLTRVRQQIDAALRAPPESVRDRAALQAALQEQDRLLETFAAVLRLARLEAQGGWRFEAIDYTALAHDISELYEPAAQDAGLLLETQIAPDLHGRGDPALLAQALSNLIENALKYTPAGGRILITAAAQNGDRIQLCVCDDGPGIPEAERDRVQERFVRLEAARDTPGVGLGLSLVAAAARAHRGSLTMREGIGDPGSERPGVGAVLSLPALPESGSASHDP